MTDFYDDDDYIDPHILAHSDLLSYCITQNPNYFVGNHHRVMAEKLMAVERGEIKRLIITMPPRHGKPCENSQPIQMVSGERIELGKVKTGDYVISHTGKPRKVLNVFEHGLLDCVEITMFSGRKTIAAYDHPYMTTEGYVNAVDLLSKCCLIPAYVSAGKINYSNLLSIYETKQLLLDTYDDLDIFNLMWILHYIENKYFGDKVVSVEKIGKRECRCLEVDIDHTFLLNDLVVHNSQLASEYFVAWYLGRNPDKQVIFTTYSGDKAVDVGRNVRNQLLDPTFQSTFHKCSISPDAQAATNFTTTNKGTYVAVGVGGAITGRGAHLLLCDDVIKSREQAESKNVRTKIIEWFGAVAYTRLMTNDNAVILIMTRWHFDDLIGYAIKELEHENWEIINLPAIADDDESYTFENGDVWERKEGEPLWPEYYDKERLEAVKKTLKSRDWNSLYQQRPQPDEGGMVNLKWFDGPDGDRRYDIKAIPKIERIYFSADTAFKDKAINDPSAIIVFGESKGLFYILEVINERMQYPDLKNTCIRLYNKYKETGAGIKAFLVEDKASGQSLIQDLRREPGVFMPIIPITPDINKILRLDECTGFLEGGYVRLPQRATWLSDFETQLERFPYDKHDDMVDSLSQFLKWKFKIKKYKNREKKKSRFWK